MGDQSDGSSSAAQGAQLTEPAAGGMFSRIAQTLGLAQNSPPPSRDADPLGPARTHHAMVDPTTLRRMRVDDVAIPKAEIVAVADDITKDDLVKTFRESGMTRLPVFAETLDTPVGLVHLKDFALTHGFNGGGEDFSLKSMVRPLLFAPPSMPIGVLLQKMQTERMHMALVIDEYGGVDGLLTIEDLIEQVVGEIEDEHDIAESRTWSLEKPGCYLAQARTPLEEFEEAIGIPLRESFEDEEIDTLGGLVFVLIGRVPVRGEVIPHPAGVEIEVVDADPRRIKRLRVRVPSAE